MQLGYAIGFVNSDRKDDCSPGDHIFYPTVGEALVAYREYLTNRLEMSKGCVVDETTRLKNYDNWDRGQDTPARK